MENNNYNADNTMGFYDLWKVFASKWKIILIIGLIAALLGGGVGLLTSEKKVEYSSVISFNLTPSDSTDALLYNLQSEMFAEKLLLEENGLPKKELCNEKDYAAAVAANEAFEKARVEKAELKKALDKFNDAHNMVWLEKEYNHLVTRCEELVAILNAIAQDGTNIEKIEAYEKALQEETAIRDEKYAAYAQLVEQKQKIQSEYNLKTIEVKDLREAAEEASEKVIAAWRDDADVRAKISIINNSVTYEYAKLFAAGTTSEQTPADVQNKGYIKIKLFVLNDEKFAKELVELYKERVPDFVEKHMEEISGTTVAVCTRISPFSNVNATTTGVIKGIIKYIVVFGIAAVVVTYLVCLLAYAVKKSENAKNVSVVKSDADNDNETDKN